MTEVTIVFADLTGSTGLYEALGNAQATELVTGATQRLGVMCESRGGRVFKYLGDGVLVSFEHNTAAAQCVIEMQRAHTERIRSMPGKMKMMLKIGLARGEIVEKNGDCFGDPVNVASRLCDLSGPEQILATENVIEQLATDVDVRARNLGAMSIRGRVEPTVVYQIEWQTEVASAFLTIAASLESMALVDNSMDANIRLTWLNTQACFQRKDVPIYLGRVSQAQFVVDDQRVSRLHAMIDWRGNNFTLEDLSSFGTWVRFHAQSASIALRRQECVLLDKGEIALGASFDDVSVPTITFEVGGASSGLHSRRKRH